ncbi:hypothetical protein GGI42DRAFT_268780 [Trichoderma sp. SZMC 28013]
MLSSKLLFLLFSSISSAAVIPRDNSVPPGYCCFTLSDPSTGKTVQQNTEYGFLYFDASQPLGSYCINLSDTTRPILWGDGFNNACIIAWDGHFQCLDPTPGDDKWALGHNGSSSSTPLLLHNGSPTYQACPNTSGGEFISSGATGVSGCRNVQLEATGLKGTCSGFTS